MDGGGERGRRREEGEENATHCVLCVCFMIETKSM